MTPVLGVGGTRAIGSCWNLPVPHPVTAQPPSRPLTPPLLQSICGLWPIGDITRFGADRRNLVSVISLAAASTICALACPSRVKSFSRDQWCDEHRHSLVHYWADAWKMR